MKFLKVVVLPIVLLGIAGLVTLAFYSDLPNSTKILLCPLLAELALLLYFWKYQLTKNTTSGLFYIYMTFLVMLVFTVKIIATFLYANGTITWMPYSVIYFTFVGVVFLAGVILKIIYGGVNDSIKMQYKGENNLSIMKNISLEIIFVLEQSKNETIKTIKLVKQISEALQYSDPVTNKKVIPLEKIIIGKLDTTLKYAKNRHFNKIKEVIKGSNGILYLIGKRNDTLRNIK